MFAYVMRRLLQFIPVVILASIGVWAIIYAIPGDPAIAMVGPNATEATIAAARARLGLDQPVIVQYFHWIGNIFTGDLGQSAISGEPVSTMLADRIPASIQLTVLSMIIGLIIAFPIGMIAAVKPRSIATKIINFYQAVALAVPTFWVGILAILAFAVETKVFPSVSKYVPVWTDPVGALMNTLMPAAVLGISISGIIARFLAASLRESLSAEFVRTARAKGVPEGLVITRHGLRNALLPTVTVVGLQIGVFLGGTVVTEVVFTYPGLGRLIYTAVTSRDYPVIQAEVLFIVVAFLLINLCVDVLYAYLDPRVRLS